MNDTKVDVEQHKYLNIRDLINHNSCMYFHYDEKSHYILKEKDVYLFWTDKKQAHNFKQGFVLKFNIGAFLNTILPELSAETNFIGINWSCDNKEVFNINKLSHVLKKDGKHI